MNHKHIGYITSSTTIYSTINNSKGIKRKIQNTMMDYLPKGKRSKRIIDLNNRKRIMLLNPRRKQNRESTSKELVVKNYKKNNKLKNKSILKEKSGVICQLTQDELDKYYIVSTKCQEQGVYNPSNYNTPSKLWEKRLVLLKKINFLVRYRSLTHRDFAHL